LVRRRANVLITGATTAGKTSLLASMAALTDRSERLVVIEDTSEITVDDRHAVRLEARRAGVDGQREITLDELVRTALRLRPDRLIVGEFRGHEVLAVVQALNTGHDGSLSTCHANGAIDGLRRVETLVMQSAPSWPLPAIRAQVSRSFDAVVHVERRSDGRRRVSEIVEVVETSGEPSGRPVVTAGQVVGEFTRGRA
jgi:pilus assembly protein CpaF